MSHTDIIDNTQNTEEQQLRECPFCGGTPKLTQKGTNQITIKCKSCHTQRTQKVLRYSIDWLREGMIKDWNTRKASAVNKQEVASEAWDAAIRWHTNSFLMPHRGPVPHKQIYLNNLK
jgi:hypothetical protein